MAADGGCLCGAVRCRLEGPPPHADYYCHCRLCQRAAGAPVVAWGTRPADRFAWTTGRVRWLEIGDELPRHAGARSEGEGGGP